MRIRCVRRCSLSNGASAGAQRHAARRPPEAPRPTHPGKLAARSAPRRRPAGGSPADTPRLLSRARERRRASATPLGVRRRLSLRPHPGKLAARSAPRRRPAGGSPADTPRLFSRARERSPASGRGKHLLPHLSRTMLTRFRSSTPRPSHAASRPSCGPRFPAGPERLDTPAPSPLRVRDLNGARWRQYTAALPSATVGAEERPQQTN